MQEELKIKKSLHLFNLIFWKERNRTPLFDVSGEFINLTGKLHANHQGQSEGGSMLKYRLGHNSHMPNHTP